MYYSSLIDLVRTNALVGNRTLHLLYGTPEDLLRQIELLEQVGIQYVIVDLDPSRELALDVFVNKIIKKY
jgi:hypothetical protein